MSEFLDQFRPEVTGYRHGDYHLGHDLESLWRASQTALYEATVFYAARVLEALSAAALDAAGLRGKTNAFSNLGRLEEYGFLPQHTRYWAHALRRAGNAVRHAGRRTAEEEEETTMAFLEYWLRWFFRDFSCGARLPVLTVRGGVTPLIRDEALSGALEMIASKDFEPGLAAEEMRRGAWKKAARATGVLGVLAERFLEVNRLEEARTFLDEAAGRHPDNLRLVQLRGLCYSRAGLLDEAIEILEPFYKRYRTDDEMAGIMAGVYKRKWRAEPEDRRWLAKSHRAYEAGWKQDRENTYLGINVATTNLFLDRPDEAETIAAEVRDVLTSRGRFLARNPQGPQRAVSLWERLTLVEAELLCGRFEAAGGEFAEIARDHPDAVGSLAVARQQFLEIAERLGAPDGIFREVPSK